MDNLREVYDRTLLPKLNQLEVERRRLMALALYFTLGAFLSIPVIIYPFLLIGLPDIFFVSILGIGGLAGWAFNTYHWTPFKQLYSREIMAPLAQTLLPEFTYIPDGMILREDVFKGNFVALKDLSVPHFFSRTSGESYKGDNYFDGMVGNTRLQFSQLNITERRSSGKNSHTVTLFKGLYLVVDFHKEFSGQTTLLPRDSFESLAQRAKKYLKSMLSEDMKSLNTSSETFNEAYASYTDDRLEARYILSENLMDRFLELGKSTEEHIGGTRPYFSFVDSSLMIGIPLPFRLFEPKLFEGLPDSYEQFVSYQEILECVKGTVNELNMNRRIWTKC